MAKKTNDKLILETKALIEIKEKALKSSERFNPITNCSLDLLGIRLNLNVMNKEQIMIASSVLMGLQKNFPDAVVQGYTVDQWLTDLASRFNVLDRTIEQERLKVLKAQLHNLLTTETKTSLELDKLLKQV